MVNAEDYSVQVLGLKNGHQEMRFKLGDSFFEAFEGDEFNGEQLVVELGDLQPTQANSHELKIV